MKFANVIHEAAERLEAEGIDDARLEAEVLMAHAAGIDRAHVLAKLADDVAADARARFDALVARRLRREPLAYIVGHREFYGIDIRCAPGALIPRPETEMLVDIALGEIRERGGGARIVDVGTGSGAIAVAVALNAPEQRVTAVESSEAALAVARLNVEAFGLSGRVELRRADLLEGAAEFDVIVANLPYVSEDDWRSLPPEIRDYEPRDGLVGGPHGTEVLERFVAQAPPHLAPGGVLAAEIGDTQAARMLEAAGRAFPDKRAYVMKDLAGRDRVLVVRSVPGG